MHVVLQPYSPMSTPPPVGPVDAHTHVFPMHVSRCLESASWMRFEITIRDSKIGTAFTGYSTSFQCKGGIGRHTRHNIATSRGVVTALKIVGTVDAFY